MGTPQRRRLPGWLADYLADPTYGGLPALLLVLTFTTGLVDAVSILALGRVFVANMTGNVVFIGFALAGAPGFSLQASLVALAGFLVGASLGGVLVGRSGDDRVRLLRWSESSEALLLLASGLLLLVAARPFGSGVIDVAVALAGVALGLRNAAVRRLAVPDMTTTVLTMTLTGIAADLRRRDVRVATRRVVVVLAMLGGAAVGAVLDLHASPAVPLLIAAGFAAALVPALSVVRRPEPLPPSR